MVTINISLNDDLATIVDQEMKDKKFANRSEFFRHLIREAYVSKSKAVIEEIDQNDADYKLLAERKKSAKFLNESEVF